MFVSVDGAQIYATSFGPVGGPVILGVGGWIGNWELWAEPFAILSRRWQTIAFDHRGAGATVAPVASIVPNRLVDDVFAVLDAFSVRQCVLAAESAGAVTALGAALRDPERITGLVIVDGLAYAPQRAEDDPFLLGLQHNYEATLDWFVEACVPEPGSGPVKRWGRQILARASQEAAIALYRSTGQIDLRPDLHRIMQPVLVVHGSADAVVPMAEGEWLAQSLPNARLAMIDGAGHVPTMTRPSVVAAEIERFFQ